MATITHTTTPGPWRVKYSAIRSAYCITSESCERQVSWINGDSWTSRMGESEANATLIARSPELLAALQTIVNAHEALGPQIDPLTKAAAWDQSAAVARTTLSALSRNGDATPPGNRDKLGSLFRWK